MLIRFIQRNQGHRDSVMHEFHSNVNKVNKAVAKVRTIGDRLPLIVNAYMYMCTYVCIANQNKISLQTNKRTNNKMA